MAFFDQHLELLREDQRLETGQIMKKQSTLITPPMWSG